MLAQDIVAATQADVQTEIGAENPVLLDYVNRAQLYILKSSRWKFQLSGVQRFITEMGQSDYWVGPNATGPNTAVDTALNLSDVEFVKEGSVRDLSNYRNLGRTSEAPAIAKLTFQDASFRYGRPRVWRFDNDKPNVLSIYPAPDNQNAVTPTPEAPYCSTTAGGSLAQRTYYVTITLVDSLGGESQASTLETKVTIPANKLLVVHPPLLPFASAASGVTYSKYNIYASTASNQETLQNVSPVLTTSTFTEPTSGLVTSGAPAPSGSSLATLDGYIIEFRYFQQRQLVTSQTNTLQVPDEYRDVMVAGVNWLALNYLKHYDEAMVWQQAFQDGIKGMVRDKNIFPKAQEYISPDPASVSSSMPSAETVQLSNLLNI